MSSSSSKPADLSANLGEGLFLNALAIALCWLSLHVSVLYWSARLWKKIRGNHSDLSLQQVMERSVQSYIVLWFGGLALFALAPDYVWLSYVGVSFGFYRLQDLLFASLDDALKLTETYREFDAAGRIVILLVNVFQIVLVFAVAYRVIAGADIFGDQLPSPSRFDYFVLSWNSLPLLGGLPSLKTTTGQVLGITESVVGVLVGVIALSAFMDGSEG